ncbi:hypothetical protein MKD41_10115 [Lutibacter sp. A64]|uniref:hypothetical protein n=1 Tax=Lutibacter sp. A64 TaxID=2918526 RepID=UPI001F064771|nr:hypothetical protein [Lutibacter sp. A64]UMB52690.1 hypothetical protein MKD41_10115 [Lutibacter sp. A64]
MKKIKLVSYAIIALFLIANISSCTGDDGIDGLQGPVGVTGSDGVDGVDGADGADGADGIDGQDGADGQDGIDGQDGADGVDGIDGQDGADGVDGIDGQDGADGADGIDGQDGADGADGVDGQDGADGADGIDGQDGADGADGNANVSTYVFNNPTWTEFSYMKLSLGSFLTEHNIKEDVILGYVKNRNRISVYSIPGLYRGPLAWKNYTMEISAQLNIFIYSFELDGSLTPYADLLPMEWFKCVIIPSSSLTETDGNTAGKDSSKTKRQIILNKLEAAGVDVKDYNAVCDYYGISKK